MTSGKQPTLKSATNTTQHPVRDNQPIPGSSVEVQSLLSDSTDSSDDPSASED